MSELKKIAEECANRIFDRIELCRGFALLKSDVTSEVESALRKTANTDEIEYSLVDTLIRLFPHIDPSQLRRAVSYWNRGLNANEIAEELYPKARRGDLWKYHLGNID